MKSSSHFNLIVMSLDKTKISYINDQLIRCFVLNKTWPLNKVFYAVVNEKQLFTPPNNVHSSF